MKSDLGHTEQLADALQAKVKDITLRVWHTQATHRVKDTHEFHHT